MSISEPFIRRPVATSLLTAAVLMAGVLGYTKLPVAPLPQVEFPTISVSAGLPGANPETMASAVATPLERQFGRIAGVTQMTSNSSSGSTNITLQFDLDRDIDAAARDVQAAINAAWVLHTNDQLFKAWQYRSLIVTSRDGKPVILSEVADVVDSVENINSAGSVNGKPAISLVLFRQPGANIIGTVDRVRALLPQLQAAVPPSIHIEPVVDRTTTIRASVYDVERTLAISIGLVILVVFLFLRSAWATVIPSVAVPLSLIGTFGVMYLLGYSLDNLSLMSERLSSE